MKVIENFDTGQETTKLNRLNSKVLNQKFASYYSTYKSKSSFKEEDEILDNLIKSLISDEEFYSFYDMIRETESIFIEFQFLDMNKKIEILVKIYFFTKELKEQVEKLNQILQIEKEELIKKNESIIKEKEENIKQTLECLRLENECYKNDISDLKKLNSNIQKENENLKNKIKDFKKAIEEKEKNKESIHRFDWEEEIKLKIIEENLKIIQANLETMTKQKENFELLSKEYIDKYEDLQIRYEKLINYNIELQDINKRLEHLNFERKCSQSNPGINLGGLMMSSHNMSEEIYEKAEDALESKGYLKVNVKPVKLQYNPRGGIPKSILREDHKNVSMLHSEVHLKSFVKVYIFLNNRNNSKETPSLFEFGTMNSTVSDNEYLDMSYSRQPSNQYSYKNSIQNSGTVIEKLQSDEIESSSAFGFSSPIIGQGYIQIPKGSKILRYTKDDCPTDNEDYSIYKEENCNFINTNKKISQEFRLNSFSDYEYESQSLNSPNIQFLNKCSVKENINLNPILSPFQLHDVNEFNIKCENNQSYFIKDVREN